ncbi:Transmembrane channel-like protein 7, partial [Bienertia sinuspersici]
MFILQRRLETIKLNAEDQRKLRKLLEQETKEKWDYWRQRAKSKWDDWGDQTTGFFFKSVKTRKVKNDIRAIKNEEDQWKVEDQNIKNIFHKYFSDLLRPNEMEEVNPKDRTP